MTLPSHRLRWVFACLVALALLTGCEKQPELVALEGQAMGTFWHVTFVPTSAVLNNDGLKQGIADVLERLEASMSTYRPHSDISRFNKLSAGEPFTPDADFTVVLDAALEVGKKSGGAYDVTIGPLIEVWGFGAKGRRTTLPEKQEIEKALAASGVSALRWEKNLGQLTKTRPVGLDFSSLVKGYAVDAVALWLQSQGIEQYLVEVGGELRVAGGKPNGQPWRVAIEQPEVMSGDIAATLALTNAAVATSGDYRNFFEVDGKRYSHTIDPRTGYPVDHNLVSVTVIHDSAMFADAWATALLVVGTEQALRLAKQYNLAVFLIRRKDDAFIAISSPAFGPYL
ncbi:MAG: hypothetical protein CSA53_02965 [Gammaproteobacteria bacterium]|nr:MAG: hypothetical protein CSA53_02965 [Gammaproteobacteria bacterium]